MPDAGKTLLHNNMLCDSVKCYFLLWYSYSGGYHSIDEQRMCHYLAVYLVVECPGFVPKVALKKQNHKTQLSKFGLDITDQITNQ